MSDNVMVTICLTKKEYEKGMAYSKLLDIDNTPDFIQMLVSMILEKDLLKGASVSLVLDGDCM